MWCGRTRPNAIRRLAELGLRAERQSCLSEAERHTLALADNRIAESAGWDRELLAIELPALTEILVAEGLDVSITGFSPVEIDQLATDFEQDASDPDDTIDPEWTTAIPTSKPGDLWELGKHRLLCGDARNADQVARLMESTRASMAFLDPPYNVRVRDMAGRGQVKHAEFAVASGELSRARISSGSSKARWRTLQRSRGMAPFDIGARNHGLVASQSSSSFTINLPADRSPQRPSRELREASCGYGKSCNACNDARRIEATPKWSLMPTHAA
jgi:hypothetical protein